MTPYQLRILTSQEADLKDERIGTVSMAHWRDRPKGGKRFVRQPRRR